MKTETMNTRQTIKTQYTTEQERSRKASCQLIPLMAMGGKDGTGFLLCMARPQRACPP